MTFSGTPNHPLGSYCVWACPVKQGTCCSAVTRNCGQLHARFCKPFFCSDVQSASICHCLTTVPLGEMGLILQSISRRAAFVLSLAPMGPICFTAPTLILHFDGFHLLSHLFVMVLYLLLAALILLIHSSLPIFLSIFLIILFSYLHGFPQTQRVKLTIFLFPAAH